MQTATHAGHAASGFRHEAFFYAGMDDFLAGTVPFLQAAAAAGEAALVVVSEAKIDRLREALDGDAGKVSFLDMSAVGKNPARIIPAWRDFVAEHSPRGRPFRGIGEPIYLERNDAELAECQRHESLLNLAFVDAPPWWLLCPYDVEALPADIIGEAHRSHPYVMEGEQRSASRSYRGIKGFDPFTGPLPEPAGPVSELPFHRGPLTALRHFVLDHATAAGINLSRTDDLLLAVTEAASNSVRYGGGRGTLRVWQDGRALVCEIRDRGRLTYPLAGRERPPDDRVGGRGLWLVNHLCDLVQLRSSSRGTVVRLHMWL
jgi:anti-sigma regulatory factor (Ser/Thr protein kinase)